MNTPLKTSLLLFTLLIHAPLSLADSAIFAGGCFWCMESDFEKLAGVETVVSGYSGGHTLNPTYKQVTYDSTGHYEVVKITYDANKVSYDELLAHYWKNIDPFDAQGQFCDKGDSYRSAIFVTAAQKEQAQISKKTQQKKFGKQQIVTPILDASTFYPAEDYHQDYYKVNAKRYQYYRWRCGRDQRLEDVWGAK